MGIYEKSLKILRKKFIEEDITRENWDLYAHDNFLHSAVTLISRTKVMNFEMLKKKLQKYKSQDERVLTLSEKADNRLVDKIENARRELHINIEMYRIIFKRNKKRK